jgi:uncharacterized protein (TIGR03435 family)
MNMKPARTASSPRPHWALTFLLATFASALCGRESRTAQVGDAALRLPEFEVASVKPTDLSRDILVATHVYPGGRVVISGCELIGLIEIAFQVLPWQISGAAVWAQEDKYEVEAVPPKAMQASIEDLRVGHFEIADEHLREMLQSLLIHRFQLKFHWATKTGDVYLLKSNGKPPAFRPSRADPSSPRYGSISWRGRRQWEIYAATMPQLAEYLSAHVLGAPVLDRTGLIGRLDYKQTQPGLDPADPGDDLSSSFLRFIQELQLKLERTKGPVETFVIDRAAKPSAN